MHILWGIAVVAVLAAVLTWLWRRLETQRLIQQRLLAPPDGSPAAVRDRVAKIDEDLPITLELLATLADAGIGFDAALDRILASQPADRPLAEELRVFQVELQAGRPRTECLRRLGRRIDVSSLTVLIS